LRYFSMKKDAMMPRRLRKMCIRECTHLRAFEHIPKAKSSTFAPAGATADRQGPIKRWQLPLLS
jgi:hypothetical protein